MDATGRRGHDVGTSDLTPADGVPCEVSRYPVGLCTWSRGHLGQHVAGDGHRIVGTRPAETRRG